MPRSLLSNRVFLLSLLTAAALSLGTVQPAFAFSIFGITLFEDESEAAANAVIADPRSYSVDVSVAGNADLLDAVRNASALWGGREAPASGAAGLLATARADYRRIQTALYDSGYYGGAISIRVAGEEAADLAPDTTLTNPISVVIKVDTGPLFHFGAAQIVNAATMSGAGENVTPPGAIGFVSGQPARAGVVRKAAILAVQAWQQQGYPKAEITARTVTADHKTNTLDAVLTVSSGPHAVLGAISVEGATDMNPDFIVQHTGLKPGAEYDPDDIARARENLANLDVFSSIKIAEADSVSADGSLPLIITVQERKPRRIGAGATMSTTDGLGVETYFLHRNLFGNGERLKLTAKLAGIGFPISTADFDYYFGGSFTKPGVITPDTDLTAELVAQRTVLTRYTETSLNTRLGLSHQFSSEIAVGGGIEAEHANFYDDLYGSRTFTLAGLYSSLTYDTRDDATDPGSGIYAKISADPFYEFQYGNAGMKVDAEARAYLGLSEDNRFTLAGRVRAGFLFGPSIAETPPDRLFFAGGGGSVRGYSYRSIGVDGPGGTVTGGRFIAEGSVEARFKVTDDIGLVGFADAGYVTGDTFVDFDTGTRFGVGVGLRYYTGFGPLRLDFAVPLNKRSGDPDYALYVGIGQAF